MKGIVILTHKDSQFKDLVSHNIEILKEFNVKIAENGEQSKYEQLGLETGIMYFDEFILLQDSVKIKDTSLFKKMLESPRSVFLSNWGQNYFCKYKSDILKKIKIDIKDKKDSVEYERELHKLYKQFENPEIMLDGCLENTNVFEKAYGRNNMICENEYFKKYKGTWDMTML